VRAWVVGRSLREVVAPAFDEVEAAARSGLFDAWAISTWSSATPSVRDEEPWPVRPSCTPILRALIESGTALEINTSGLRHPCRDVSVGGHRRRFRSSAGARSRSDRRPPRGAFGWAWPTAIGGDRTASRAGLPPGAPRGDRGPHRGAHGPNGPGGRSL
jgi:hypothetical protein